MRTPAPEFTTYHRHRRRPDGKNARTGDAPSYKHCRHRSHAYCSPDGPDSDRADRHRSRTWKGHHMHSPRTVALVPTRSVSKTSLLPWHVLNLPLGIADIEGTHLVDPETWRTSGTQRLPPPSGGASAALFPGMST